MANNWRKKEIKRNDVVERVVLAADRIILEASDDSCEETNYLTARVAQRFTEKALLPFQSAISKKDFEDGRSMEENPHYWGGHHKLPEGGELYIFVLRIMKKRQGIPVPIDDFLKDEDVLSCYTPNHFMCKCNPPNIKRARQAVRSAIGYLRRKGHIIESTREYGQIAYSWHGK